jgi:hypothetical protein
MVCDVNVAARVQRDAERVREQRRERRPVAETRRTRCTLSRLNTVDRF